jgi:hypothetical protein
MNVSRRSRVALCSVVALIVCSAMGADTRAAEETVQNDSLTGGDSGIIQLGFDPGESAAAWLTSPCTGTIVAVQVLWRSSTGTQPADIEDSIKIFDGGIFPTPGIELASVDGPFMTDGVFNEFRYLDENQVIPLSVPVTDGQDFVVSFKFLNDPNPTTGPSVVNDTDGCQNGRNAIDAAGLGWFNACLLGVTGDWVIRSVVDCAPAAGSGSIPNGGDTPGQPMRISLVGGQLELTWEPSCEAADTNYEIYEGFLGAYPSHFSKFCNLGNVTTTSFPPDGFNRYYLVVPSGSGQEGSYGRDSSGNERPQGGGPCQTVQSISCP